MITAILGSRERSSLDEAASPAVKAVRWAAVLLGLGGLAVLVAWLLGWIRLFTDPRLVEIRSMQAEASRRFTADGGPQTLAEAQDAVASMRQIREKIEALPANLRRQAEGGSMLRSAMQARMNAYFSLPPEQRQAELDRQIRQEELFRQAWRQSQGPGGGPGGGGAETTASAAGQGASGGQAGAGSAVQAQGGGAPGGGGFGGPGFGPPRGGTEEDRNRWRKSMIDRTTPEQRARFVEYRRAMDARRAQLGLPATGPR